jgi:hypothetical protein
MERCSRPPPIPLQLSDSPSLEGGAVKMSRIIFSSRLVKMVSVVCKNVPTCGKSGLKPSLVSIVEANMTAPIMTSTEFVPNALYAVKKVKNLSITTSMVYSRRAMGFLWERRTQLDPSQVALLEALYAKKKKGSLECSFQSIYKLSRSNAGRLGYGRLYGSKGSIEKLEKECRGTLCKEFYHDIDIKNAHPVFLVQFAKHYYGKDMVEVERYVNDRDAYLQRISDNRDEAKQEIIRVFYGGKPNQDFLNPLYNEVRKFTQFLMNQTEFEDLKVAVKNEDNVYGSFLSYILQTIEREIMLTMKASLEADGWSVDVLAYDGVMVRRNPSLDLNQSMATATTLIKSKHGYSVELLDKELTAFDIPESKEEIVDGVSKEAYLQMKMDFETNHFYFIPTNQYAELENGVCNFYDLNHATEYFKQHWRFPISGKFGDYVEFFKLWRDDPSRRSIKSIDYKPTDDPFVFVPTLDFAYKTFTCEPNEDAVKYFKDLMRVNTGNDAVLYEWITNYFAHMLQKPFELPKIAAVFTGDKGTGKDTPVDFLMEYVIGKNFSINYQSNHQFFDRYDCGRANKFLVKLEEADRKACLTESSFLKSAITADKSTFNPKGKNAYQLPNYNRYVFTTNKANPMEVSTGERRFVILGCSSELKGNHQFWKGLRETLFTEAGGLAVANYLLSVDLSNFNIREMPKNNYMDQVIESEKSAEERFVEHWEGTDELSSSEMYSAYRSFCIENDIPPCPNSITLGKLLMRFVRDGIIKAKKGGGNKTYYSK